MKYLTLQEYKDNVRRLQEGGAHEQVIFTYTDMVCENNLPLFCYVMLPHMFTKPIGEVHMEIMENLIDRDINKLVTAIPRKHGKTTILKAFILWVIAYKKFEYVVWLGDTLDKVAKHLTNVKHEMSTNSVYRQVYGEFDKGAVKWNDAEILLENGFHLICAGQHYKFRGLLDIVPPDLLLIDDLDDDETVENPNSRTKLDNWFYNSALTAIDQHKGIVRMFGTVIHNDCQLMRVIKNPSFKSIVYSCCDEENETALCPEMYSFDWLMKQKEMLFRATPPKVQTWWQEWMNKPTNPDNAKWDINQLGLYTGEFKDRILYIDGKEIPVRTLTAVDIASAKGREKSDKTVVLTVGIDKDWNIWVLKYFRQTNAKPSETVRAIIQQHKAYQTSDVVMEQIGVMDLIMETYDNAAAQEQSMPALSEIRSRGNISKVDRISWALQDKLRQGKIWLRDGMTDLQEEFDTFPRGAHDDLLDCLADCVRNGYPPIDFEEDKKDESWLPIELRTDDEERVSKSAANQIVNL